MCLSGNNDGFLCVYDVFFFVMIGLYIHMIVAVNLLAVASAASKAKLRGKMTRMIAISCLVLTFVTP